MKVKISGSSLVGLSEGERKKRIMRAFREAKALSVEEREKLIEQLKAEIRVYELKNKLESSKLEEALEKGEISQTPEVTSWLLTYHMIRKLQEAGNMAGTA